MYLTRQIKLDSQMIPELDDLCLASGQVWSDLVKSFWRVVRRKGIWLRKYDLQKWICKTDRYTGISAQSIQAVNFQFFDALASWRQLRKVDKKARPPRKQKRYNKVVWPNQSIRIKNGVLRLSRGRGTNPLEIPWSHPDQVPKQVELIFNKGNQTYYLHCQYLAEPKDLTKGDEIAGIDLGEIHLAATFDGTKTFLFNGREIRSKRRYQNKTKGKLQGLVASTKKGSCRRHKLIKSKQKQLSKLKNQISDILHKTSRKLVDTLLERRVSTLVIGDLKNIRNSISFGKKSNQKLHQWSFDRFLKMITYKAKLVGLKVVMINEAYTSQTCPACEARRKPQGRQYQCADCGLEAHRDAVGAFNIRKKYLQEQGLIDPMKKSIGVVGVHRVSPTGIHYHAGSKVPRSSFSCDKTFLKANNV